jgi:hypothetical protein
MEAFGGFESMPGVDVLADAYRTSGPVGRGSVTHSNPLHRANGRSAIRSTGPRHLSCEPTIGRHRETLGQTIYSVPLSSSRMITRSGRGRSTQLKPRSSNTCSRPRKALSERCADLAKGQPSMAEAPSRRASSTAARTSAWVTPWPRRPARTKRQGRSHTISSSLGARFRMILLRGLVAATYRDRGPQAHQPTGSAACKARIPIGVELAAAIAPNRRWFPPLSQPAANWLLVTQNAMHQQRRVVL